MSLLASLAVGKRYRFITVWIFVGVVLSGCGGSSSGDDSVAASVSSAASSSSATASSLSSSSISVIASSSAPASSSVSSNDSSAAVSSSVSSSSASSDASSLSSSSAANLVSQKRGLAYGYHSLADLSVMQPQRVSVLLVYWPHRRRFLGISLYRYFSGRWTAESPGRFVHGHSGGKLSSHPARPH